MSNIVLCLNELKRPRYLHTKKDLSNLIDKINFTNANNNICDIVEYICRNGYVDLLEKVINKNYDINRVNNIPLIYLAVNYNKLEVLKVLVKYGADINIEWNNENILEHSIKVKDKKILKYIFTTPEFKNLY